MYCFFFRVLDKFDNEAKNYKFCGAHESFEVKVIDIV